LFGTGKIENWMKVKPEIRKNVEFAQFNLLSSSPPWTSQFDVIFCRNVLIYFPLDVIQQVIHLLYQAAAPGAILFISHSESLQRIQHQWKLIKPSIFMKDPF
jgi:chemotaxis protein methyltransferase CheR